LRRLTVTGPLSVGFYGKLPVVGDFVRRDVDARIVDAWDEWLQASIATSRDALGARWLELYLTAPMWRFCAPRGVLAELPVAGVMFPSVDRVGRYFPFTVFALLPDTAVGLVVADRCVAWFERIEDLVLAQLDDEGHDVDEMAAALATTSDQLAASLQTLPQDLSSTGFREIGDALNGCLHLPLGERVDVGPTALTWLEHQIQRSITNAMFWWSSGSASVQPSWLVTKGLPPPQAYAAMISGAWSDWPWSSGDVLATQTLFLTSPMTLESGGSSHPGKVRQENQDAWLARPELGLWAVADGMGGHSAGHVASRATVDALNGLEARASFPEFVRLVRESLTEVNRYLYSLSQRAVNPTVIGTTVVAMLVRDGTGVVLWAGDSRLYRCRGDELEQLTVDHSEVSESELESVLASSNVITRALGGHDEIELEQLSFDVKPGDRFLLCSDGLYRELSHDDLRSMINDGDAAAAPKAMIERVLRGEAADNVTVVVVAANAATG